MFDKGSEWFCQSDDGGTKNVNAGKIGFADITVSQLNPRHDAEDDAGGLAKSITSTGLLQPILLRKRAATDGRQHCEVIAGSRRVHALRTLRGEGGYLEPHEYQVVDCDDGQAALMALAENRDRTDLTALEAAHQIGLIAKLKGITNDSDLAALTRIGRQHINDARALAADFDRLPESWRRDYEKPDCRPDDTAHPFRLTLTHFVHIRRFLHQKTISATVLALLESCITEHWPANVLRRAITKLESSHTPKPPPKPNYRVVRRAVEKAIAACDPTDDLFHKFTALLPDIDRYIFDKRRRSKRQIRPRSKQAAGTDAALAPETAKDPKEVAGK